MAEATKVIAFVSPRDGREWDAQCARCGSSTFGVDCDYCEDGWIEDDDWQADEGDGWTCEACCGQGGHQVCCSSVEWCEANPAKGREETKRGEIEWFTFDKPKSVPAGATPMAEGATESAPDRSSSTKVTS